MKHALIAALVSCAACTLDLPEFPTDSGIVPLAADASILDFDARVDAGLDSGALAPEIDSGMNVICGDAVQHQDEQCDDGDRQSGDGCDNLCRVEGGWVCNQSEPSRCTPVCGDRRLAGDETCDDGNGNNGDGCNAACAIEDGWVCVPDLLPSACFLELQAVFADDCVAGPAQPQGSVLDPYCSIGEALGARRPTTVVLPGLYRERVLIREPTSLIGVGDPAIEPMASGTVLTIELAGSVNVDGLVILGNGAGSGGVVIRDSSVVMTDCSIGPSSEIGIETRGSSFLHLARTRVTNNAGGGVFLEGTNGSLLYNNVIAENAGFGGVRIRRWPAGSTFANNTVADNSGTLTWAGGVECEVEAQLENSILWANDGAEPSGVSALCDVRYSVINTAPALGSFLIHSDPELDPSYHLRSGSSAIDGADPSGTIANAGPAPVDDLDGERRPTGIAVDIGADEAR